MIDLTTEVLISLNDASRIVPAARRGKKTHLSTLLRWILKGCRGPNGTTVRLEAIRVGNRWMTSRQALQRFAESLTPRIGSGEKTPTIRTSAARQRESERAATELSALVCSGAL
jgi:Protein of unknown function (DUF1580)